MKQESSTRAVIIYVDISGALHVPSFFPHNHFLSPKKSEEGTERNLFTVFFFIMGLSLYAVYLSAGEKKDRSSYAALGSTAIL